MSKLITLAVKVLSETNSQMTAAQIWHHASSVGLDAGIDFGKRPIEALRNALRRDVNGNPGPLISTHGRPRYYYLRTTDMSITWGKMEEKADDLESLGQARLLEEIVSSPPHRIQTVKQAVVFERDPRVIAYVRLRAGHHCERCGDPGFDMGAGRRYVEVHHLVRIADGGADVPTNAVAVCATCHRILHYAVGKEQLRQQLVTDLTARGIDIKPH